MIPTTRKPGPADSKTALGMGAMLLCAYAALHLSAAGIVRLITGQDAAAIVAPNAPAAMAAGSEAREGTWAVTASGRTQDLAVSVRSVRAHACKPGRPIDSRCIYD